jgi:uncharacterized protein (DUF1015 family)
MSFEIAPLRALRFDLEKLAAAGVKNTSALVSPPYDIIDADEHAELLARSDYNIVRLTLGESPGEKEDYRARGDRILDWKSRGILREDDTPAIYVYGCDYTVPGTDIEARFRGVASLGRLHKFEEGEVLPHERTFPRVVDDRFKLLDATRTHLEAIFVLYEDAEKAIDTILEEHSKGEPLFKVEGRPGEIHSLWAITDADAMQRLQDLFRAQRPIIADGHHRYTTAILFRDRKAESGESVPGNEWQPMVFGNLVGDGLSILATHRLVDTGGRAAQALDVLREKLDEVDAKGDAWDYRVETPEGDVGFRVPDALRSELKGVAATDYAILHERILREWLRPVIRDSRDEESNEDGGEIEAAYYKEGSGEREALAGGEGDLLFRMRPVAASEFRSVVEGGEVFPHKTTFFYPKLWSGLLLWTLADRGTA